MPAPAATSPAPIRGGARATPPRPARTKGHQPQPEPARVAVTGQGPRPRLSRAWRKRSAAKSTATPKPWSLGTYQCDQ